MNTINEFRIFLMKNYDLCLNVAMFSMLNLTYCVESLKHEGANSQKVTVKTFQPKQTLQSITNYKLLKSIRPKI